MNRKKETLGVKLLLAVLFIGGFIDLWVIVQSPEYRLIGIIAYFVGVLAVLGITKKVELTKGEKYLMWILIITGLIDVLLMISSPLYRIAGFLYLLMISFTLIFLTRKAKIL